MNKKTRSHPTLKPACTKYVFVLRFATNCKIKKIFFTPIRTKFVAPHRGKNVGWSKDKLNWL